MLEPSDVIISTSTTDNAFLKIDKDVVFNRYIVKIFYNISLESLTDIYELLRDYGDVFAAYVNSIKTSATIEEKENLIKTFTTSMEDMEIIAAKTDDSLFHANFGNANVNNVSKVNNYIEFAGHLYVFANKSKSK
jgi:hypothetical protein